PLVHPTGPPPPITHSDQHKHHRTRRGRPPGGQVDIGHVIAGQRGGIWWTSAVDILGEIHCRCPPGCTLPTVTFWGGRQVRPPPLLLRAPGDGPASPGRAPAEAGGPTGPTAQPRRSTNMRFTRKDRQALRNPNLAARTR